MFFWHVTFSTYFCMPWYYLSVSVGMAVMPDSSFLLVFMGFLLFRPLRGTLFRTFFCTYLSRHLLLLTLPRGVKSLPTLHPHPLLIPCLNIQTPKILPKWPPAHFRSLLGPLTGPPWATFIGVWLVYSVFLLNWCAIIRHPSLSIGKLLTLKSTLLRLNIPTPAFSRIVFARIISSILQLVIILSLYIKVCLLWIV